MRDLDDMTHGPQADGQPTAVLTEQPGEGARPRRRARLVIFLLIGLLLLIALIVGGFFIAERVFRQSAEDYVREKVVATFDLPSDKGIDVDLGDGLLLPQAAGGRIDDLRVSIANLTVGKFTGSAVLTAQGVPLNLKSPADHVEVRVGMSEHALNALLLGSGALGNSKITLTEGSIRLSAEYALFGPKIAVDLVYTPGVTDGQLAFTPTEVKVNGTTLTKDGSGPLGEAAAALFSPQKYCVAAFLPESLPLQSVKAHDRVLQLSIGGDDVTLGEDLDTKGSCPTG